MSENIISTVDQLKIHLKESLSEKRYNHVCAVAETTEMLLKHFKCKDYLASWNGMSAGTFVGLAHDISRELNAQQWIEVCDGNHVDYLPEEKEKPVLLHSYVSAIIIKKLCPNVPLSWCRAIELHTLGNTDMDDLALALFVGDYIEPNREYLTESQRAKYINSETIQLCAYKVLCDILEYQEKKGSPALEKSLAMKEYLKKKIG